MAAVAAGTRSAVAAPEAPEPAPPAEDRCWPCPACATRNTFAVDACTACGLGFLADLRTAGAPSLVLPGVGDLTRLSRRALLAAACAFAVVVVLLTAVVAYLLS